jgi:primosomal replication protein N
LNAKTPARRSNLNTKPKVLENQLEVSLTKNQLNISAIVLEIEPLRYTPSGVPAVNSRLEHFSEMVEAGQVRQVKVTLKAVAFGSVAEQLVRQDIGSSWNFRGFLSTPRGAKHPVFHIQEFAKE